MACVRYVLFQWGVVAFPLLLPVRVGTLVGVLVEGFVRPHNGVVFVALSVVLAVVVADGLVKTGLSELFMGKSSYMLSSWSLP